MIYLCVKQIWLIESAGALRGGTVFTAGQRHCVVVAGEPGSAGPAGVIFDTTALQLHREDRQELIQNSRGVQQTHLTVKKRYNK